MKRRFLATDLSPVFCKHKIEVRCSKCSSIVKSFEFSDTYLDQIPSIRYLLAKLVGFRAASPIPSVDIIGQRVTK